MSAEESAFKRVTTWKEDERHFILECIRLYRDLPALWKVGSDEYRDRKKKNEAYDVLLRKFREKHPFAEREDVKKKLNSLRTNFRKELRKVLESKRSGGELYRPTQWYFDEMLFLQDLEENPPPQSSISLSQYRDDYFPDDSPEVNVKIEEEYITSEPLIMGHEPPKPVSPCIQPPPRKWMKKDDNVERERFSLPLQRHRDNQEDYVKLTAAWAVELQKMHPLQQVFAKKAINDILFEGQLGTLHRHSVVINAPRSTPSPPYSCQPSGPSSTYRDYHHYQDSEHAD